MTEPIYMTIIDAKTGANLHPHGLRIQTAAVPAAFDVLTIAGKTYSVVSRAWRIDTRDEDAVYCEVAVTQ